MLLDLWLGEQRAGIQILDAATRDIPVIVCSGQVDYLRTQAPLFRALGYQTLEKPFQRPRLLAQIEIALERWPSTD